MIRKAGSLGGALFSAMLVALGVEAQTEVPHYLTQQGRLFDAATGEPRASSPVLMTFALYDASTGGEQLWEETHSGVLSGLGVGETALCVHRPPYRAVLGLLVGGGESARGMTHSPS